MPISPILPFLSAAFAAPLEAAPLEAAPPVPRCIGQRGDASGWACRREFGGHHVLDLHGTDSAIGRMYGTLLGAELTASYVPMVDSMLAELPRPFRAAFERYESGFPEFFSAEMDARAAGLEVAIGLRPGSARKYAWLSELGSIGPALKVASSDMLQLDGLTGRPTGGCTSFVAEDGNQTVHARNVDFWGMSYWQVHAALVFVEPLTPDGQPDGFRYAQVSDLGEIFAGTTGINERGLVVTTHLHVSRDVALLDGALRRSGGSLLWRAIFGHRKHPQMAVLRVVETVLRRADSVSAAIGLMSEMRTAGAWSFILSDPNGGRAVVGMNNRDVAVTTGATVMTNQYLDPMMHARELIPARGPVEGAQLRYERASALVAARRGSMDVPAAIAILRDRYDSEAGEERVASPNSVLSPDATQSVVFVSAPGVDPVMWVAIPHGDGVTPAPLSPYFSMPFSAGFDADRCVQGCAGPTLPYQSGPLDAGATLYASAISRLVDQHDGPGALALLQSIPGQDPGIHLMAAWLAASLPDMATARAELALSRASPRTMSTHHRILAAILAGMLARSAGNEEEARREFQAALGLARDDQGRNARLNALLIPAIKARLSPGRHRPEAVPAPDLKFQDVFGLGK